MNRGRLIGGIVCLVLAGGLAIANLALPSEELMFTVGDANMPWVPPVVLGIVGTVLVATSFKPAGQRGEEAETQPQNEEKAGLNKRLETIAWGCFVLMLAGFIFVPHAAVAKGVWSVGVGAIMLGLNVSRYFYGIRLSGFTTFLGVLSLLVGVAQIAGVDALESAALFIVLGAYLVLKPWFDKRKIFGKAEQS